LEVWTGWIGCFGLQKSKATLFIDNNIGVTMNTNNHNAIIDIANATN